MTCRSIMNPDSPRLALPMTVETAIDVLFHAHLRSLPVVDEKGRFQGLFGSHQLLQLALPKAAMIDEEQGFAFVTEGPEVISERLKEVAKHSLERYLDKEGATICPDVSIVEALHLLYRHRDDLPVVDPKTGKFLGLISARRAVGKLMEQA
ncbi:MAG: CBS domain-containing protein [Rhodospirillales bacterium]|nr:MAG: CBS domain-containing protein [Rhodospirillales bacterium]